MYFSIADGIPVVSTTEQPGSIEVTQAQAAEILSVINAGGEVAIVGGQYQIVRAARPEPTLEEIRAATSIPLPELLLRCEAFTPQVVTEAEAIQIMQGVMPVWISTAVDSAAAQIALATGVTESAARLGLLLPIMEKNAMRRNGPLTPVLQSAKELTDAQVDALFGIGT